MFLKCALTRTHNKRKLQTNSGINGVQSDWRWWRPTTMLQPSLGSHVLFFWLVLSHSRSRPHWPVLQFEHQFWAYFFFHFLTTQLLLIFCCWIFTYTRVNCSAFVLLSHLNAITDEACIIHVKYWKIKWKLLHIHLTFMNIFDLGTTTLFSSFCYKRPLHFVSSREIVRENRFWLLKTYTNSSIFSMKWTRKFWQI